MSTTEVRSTDATNDAGVAKVDMKLEVVVIPVSDVDRAKEFYGRLGWRLTDVTPPGVVQFTPPGSACSVLFGPNLTSAAPGSAQGYLIVSDIEAARDALVAAGIEVSEVFHLGPDGPVQRSGSRASQLLLARHVQRSRRQQLAAAGGHDPAARAHRLCRDFVRLRKRPGERASARGGRPRRAREAHRRSATRTGPTGTPSTWWRSRPGRSRRGERLRRHPQPDRRPSAVRDA